MAGEGANHDTRGRVCSPFAGEGISARGFSLIEVLVVVALLSVIILGLVAMFNQTRRAFVSSLTQVDVLEAGRAATELISRELEQATASGSSNTINFFVDTQGNYSLLLQPLLDPTDVRTNIIQELYFVTRYNQTYNVIGYKLITPQSGIGTLYRYSSNNIAATNLAVLNLQIANFTNAVAPTNYLTRIMDGVINFRIHSFDTNGNIYALTNSTATNLTVYPAVYISTNSQGTADFNYLFTSNSLPAYVEVELGIVEDRTLAKYQALNATSPQAAQTYLINHPGQVHMFRQRIPIRNFNSAAYQ